MTRIVKYFIIKLFRPSDSKGFLPWAELCIEGFPRSGNTFAVSLLTVLKPMVRVNHHTHHIGTIRASVFFGIPTYVIIRQPLACIRSYHLYSGLPLEKVVDKWRKYHNHLLILDGFILISFKDLTHDPSGFLAKTVGFSQVGMVESPEDSAKEFISQLNERRNIDSSKSGLPDRKRQEQYKSLTTSIENLLTIEDINTYNKLVERCI